MDKTYSPADIEKKWYDTWEQRGYFRPDHEAPGNPYCIMIPPPNVTGSLHMGHAFQDTLMDALIRYHRMKGDKTLWQVGTDHAGIATQMVVERIINGEGKSRYDYGREAFKDKVWEWKEQSGGTITKQLRRMGTSVDWESERFTMDDGLSDAVHEVFVKLYEEGLIYRGKRLVNWDPVLLTAVSDLEVLSQEENGYLWHMRYPLTNGMGEMIVATTRPETMLGDFAVAIHPEDKRYRHMIGEFVELPLTGRTIPIISDEYVDPEFGTGCVKITPAHDFNDYDVWLRHRDQSAVQEQPHGGLINVFTPDGRIRENQQNEGQLIPEAYIGMDLKSARKQIIKDLDAAGLLVKIEDHKLMVPRGDRSGAVIEPFLTDQWYVHTAPLAAPAIKAVENGDIRFVPDNWKNTYYEWMHNIEDWCISRQIWWGHRIPAWYDGKGNIYVGRSEAEIRRKHGFDDDFVLVQDEDVLDTWFSSALWPFSTLGWPEKTKELETFYPTNVLVTGFDIIFFWVARMIMMGLKFMGDVPFREVYIHGLVRDAEGMKMSKSKGNVLDPLDVMDGIELDDLLIKRTSGMMQPHLADRIKRITHKHFPKGIPAFGTDAMRFTFAAMASTGRDIKLAMPRIEGYRNFCNKLWNAARFVLMNAEGKDCGQSGGELALSISDRWIISRFQQVVESIETATAQYRFDHIAQTLYEFIWNEYCDWYLELSKTTLQDDNASGAEKRGTRHTLVSVLESSLRMAHPLIPFITEEIWQRVAPLAGVSGETIMLQPYPKADEASIDRDAEADISWLQSVVLAVRQIRGEADIDPKKPLPILLQNGDDSDRQRIETYGEQLRTIGRITEIDWLTCDDPVPESMASLAGELKVLVPMAGMIDKDSEIKRLDGKIAKLKKDHEKTAAKLGNPNFVDRAPADVVAKEKTRLEELESAVSKLEEQLEKIRSL